MLRLLKRCVWVGLLAASLEASFGYTPIGPAEAYEVATIGYMLTNDLGAPKDMFTEYRRNTATMYYACDANFYLFFGPQGVAAISAAFGVFNSLSNVSSYNNDLSLTNFAYSARRQNWQAQALNLYDLKSLTMEMLIENLGLAQPDRFTWGLHDRFLLPGTACPVGETYLIVKRNFDPITGMPSSYVNNTLLSYQIVEICTGANPLGVARPFPVDPLADMSTAVAAKAGTFGTFYNGLTVDDAAGLRFLLRTNNVNFEGAGPGTTVAVTNATPSLLTGTNLALLAAQAATNAPAALQGLYPGLVVVTSSNYYSNVYTAVITTNFANFPWDPVGTPAHPIYSTNWVGTPTLFYQHTFGNVFTIQQTGNTFATTPLLTIPPATNQETVRIDTTIVSTGGRVDACNFNFLTGGAGPWTPVGTNALLATNVFTNTCSLTLTTNDVVGEVFILPTNICGLQILVSQLTNVITLTNALVTNTTALTSTNSGVTINSVAQNQLTFFTNHTYIVLQAACTADTPTLRQGIEKINFVRRDYDSLLGRFFEPITNEYVLNTVTNFQVVPQRVQRAITAPDFLFTAQDLTVGPAADPLTTPIYTRTITFNQANVNPNLAGPGTIETPTTITFNSVTPVFYNAGAAATNAFLDELSQVTLFAYATFDGSTNPITLYPNSVSQAQLENQILIQVKAVSLPQGQVSRAYSGSLQTVSGTPNWQPPFSWSLMPGSPGLPPGLNILTGGDGTGIITGIPTRDGVFDFIVRVTDGQGRTVDRSFAIKITL
jgi:hypothetical protein